MTTLILTALILLLICTAAGLIFLVVTMSDQNEDEDMMKKKKKIDSVENDYEYEVKTHSAEKPPEPQKLTLSKKSNITPFSNSIIVSHELKKDFEKALASMKPNLNPHEAGIDNSAAGTESGNQKFIDVLDLLNKENEREDETTYDESIEPSSDLDEFLIGEQILKNEDTQPE